MTIPPRPNAHQDTPLAVRALRSKSEALVDKQTELRAKQEKVRGCCSSLLCWATRGSPPRTARPRCRPLTPSTPRQVSALQRQVSQLDKECGNLQPASVFSLDADADSEQLLGALQSLRSELSEARRGVSSDEAAVTALNVRLDAEWLELRQKMTQSSREIRVRDDAIRKLAAKNEALDLLLVSLELRLEEQAAEVTARR